MNVGAPYSLERSGVTFTVREQPDPQGRKSNHHDQNSQRMSVAGVILAWTPRSNVGALAFFRERRAAGFGSRTLCQN
jgi:hypothetical protein